MLFLLIFSLALAALLILLGCLIRFKKTYGIINGYNSLTEEEKARIDKEALGKCLFYGLLLIAAFLAAGGILFYLNLTSAAIVTFVLLIPAAIAMAVISQKYLNPGSEKAEYPVPGSKKSPKSMQMRILIIASFGGILVLAAGILGLNSWCSKPTAYDIRSGQLTISGVFGETVSLSGTKSVEIKNGLPNNLKKSWGFDGGTVLKGKFTSDSSSETVFIDTSKPPFVYLTTGGENLILNCPQKSQTQALYEKLKTETEK